MNPKRNETFGQKYHYSPEEDVTLAEFIFYPNFTMNGTIKTMTGKGFGFIAVEGGGADLFFHANECENEGGYDALNVGDAVTFEQGESAKGPNAINVNLA